MTTGSQSLLEWFLSLFDPNNPEARAAFERDPQGYLEECGFEDVTPQDIADVLPLVFENSPQILDNSAAVTGGTVNIASATSTLPPPEPGDTPLETVVRQIQHVTNNYSIDQTTTNVDNSINQNIDNRGGIFEQTIDNDPVTAIGDGAQAAGDNLTTVEGEGNVVAGDDLTIEDSNVVTGSVEDSVLADDITNSNVAAGDRAAAGQGNITGDVSGEGNVVGTGNQAVTGDGSAGAFGAGSQAVGGAGNQVVGGQDNTTAFGEGDATSASGGGATATNLENVSVDDGGALSVGGSASGFNEETDVDIVNSEDVNVAQEGSTAGDQEFTDQSTQTTEVIQSDNVTVDQDNENFDQDPGLPV